MNTVASLRLARISEKHGSGFHWRCRCLIDIFLSRYIDSKLFPGSMTNGQWISPITSDAKRNHWSDRTTSASNQRQGFCHLQVSRHVIYVLNIKKYGKISCSIALTITITVSTASSPSGRCATMTSQLLSPKPLEILWRAFTFISSTLTIVKLHFHTIYFANCKASLS